MSDLILVATNIKIKVRKLNFITSNLDGSQLICREICCFEQLARKKYFAVKKENG